MKAPLSYVPALPGAAGIIAGILAWSLGAALFAAVGGMALFVALYLRRMHYPALWALMVAAGAALAMAREPAAPPQWLLDGSAHSFTAEVEEADEGSASMNYVVRVTGADGNECVPFLMRVTAGTVEHPVEPGAIIGFRGRIISDMRSEEVPHETDYASSMARQGVAGRCMADYPPEQLDAPRGVRALTNRVRRSIFNAIVDSPVNGRTAAFLVAAILGDRQYVSTDVLGPYRDTGVAHILALSGLHVAIMASMVSFLLFPLRICPGGRNITGVLTVLMVWAYAAAVGMSPSILRAAVMLSVYIAAGMIGRSANGFNSLALAVTVILCVDPMSLFDPGFQLSVAAVGSILMFGGLLPRRLKRYPLLYSGAGLAVSSVAAMAGTGIVSAYYFNSFPLLFLPANIVAGLLFPFILGGGIALASATALGLSAGWLGAGVDGTLGLMQLAIGALWSIDGSALRGVYFSAWVVAPYAVALVLLALALRHRNRLLWISTGVMAVAVFITAGLTVEHVPAAELYIPSSLSPGSVIMRAGHRAWILPLSDRPGGKSAAEEANERYRRFLLSRGCGEEFIPAGDSLTEISFRVRHGMIAAVDRRIAVVGARMPDVGASGMHVDYALLSADFRGSIAGVVSALRPDTILLAPDIHPSRRASLIRQCADSIPLRNLKRESFAIVW